MRQLSMPIDDLMLGIDKLSECISHKALRLFLTVGVMIWKGLINGLFTEAVFHVFYEI